MAFEKAKVLKAAEKFLAQGNITAAINEYRHLVDHDEDDFTALNMLGDLYVRTNKKDDAIPCFLRIAEHYREQEFNLKAIAMYKKIDRLNPRDPIIAEKLANLYALQGLIVDARAQYLIVAEACSRAGDPKKALEVLHKIADLDPQNTEVRLKLAEGYLQQGLISEASEAFAEAGEHLLDQGLFEKSLQCYSRALELKPQHHAALNGMVAAHVALGTAYEAAELLESLVSSRPDNIELISLLLHSYLEAQDAEGAERATLMLMSHDGSYYTRFIEVARLYLHHGDVDSAARVLASVTERVLAGREENQLLELVNEVLNRNPEQITGLRLLVRIHWWQRDMDKLRAALERLAEAAGAAERPDDERYALTQLVRLVPDEPRYESRLNALGGAQEEMPHEAAGLDPGFREVPTFESFAIVKEDASLQTGDSAPADEFEFNSVATDVVADPSASFADLNDELENAATLRIGSDVIDPREVDFGAAIFEDASISSAPAADDSALDAGREAMLRQELESVDFYIAQGYRDIALDTLEMLQRQFRAHPDIEARRAKLGQAGAAPVSAASVQDEGAFEFEPDGGHEDAPVVIQPGDVDIVLSGTQGPDTIRPAQAVDVTKLDRGLADVFEEFRVAAEEENAPESGDYETHYNMGIAYQEMDLLDEAIREFQSATALVSANDGTSRFLQCCNLLGHSFVKKGLPKAAVMWFKKGLAAPGHHQDEYQALRYELGSALEEMGDLSQAIDIFTEVYSIDVSYRGVADKLRELLARKS